MVKKTYNAVVKGVSDETAKKKIKTYARAAVKRKSKGGS